MSSLPVVTADSNASSGASSAFDERNLLAGELGLIYRNAVASQLVVLIVAPALAAALWNSTRPSWVLGWLAAMVVITVARLHAARMYRRLPQGEIDLDRWRTGFVLGACASGGLWGIAGLLITPQADLGTQFVVIFTLAGMVTAAAPTLAPLPVSFHLFSVLALVPLALKFLNESDQTRIVLGLLTLLYLVGMSAVTRRIHAMLRTSLELRQHNRALVDVLKRANTGADDVNKKLMLEITEHRLTERNLEKSLSVLRATLESTHDGICVVDRAGNVVSHNQRFLDMWRMSASVMAKGSVDEALAAIRPNLKDPDAFVRRTHELIAADDIESHDVVELTDGRIFERFSMPQRIGGNTVGRVCSYRDITERLHGGARPAVRRQSRRTHSPAQPFAVRPFAR